jgi:hypothetical protein
MLSWEFRCMRLYKGSETWGRKRGYYNLRGVRGLGHRETSPPLFYFVSQTVPCPHREIGFGQVAAEWNVAVCLLFHC